ncbi:hypothetical protein [Sediminispirochaeta smaragdinae]|uniref:SWIM-type domain-containing protein n=1 Tax=Sediminispirochaeta smaragdinae (strain DSM 11293 / JCM 15392 / SEBR 4228) TaxID=573413 RepID=E1R3K9_SEDSS|nr:hypothetical protein [Sediminispirochaeta smaragdinae]ADK81640.1 hypothetical protein Spirs_2527 [Sediminispirochaeta smaragdinae DSM 11293]
MRKKYAILSEDELHEDIKIIPPNDDKIIEIADRDGNTYSVNMKELSCTCEDWETDRHNFCIGDPRRCCFHIKKAFRRNNAIEEQKPVIKAILNEYHTVRLNMLFGMLGSQPVAIFYDDESPWMDVFTEIDQNKQIGRSGFNYKEKRWAYNEEPVNGDKIASFIVNSI